MSGNNYIKTSNSFSPIFLIGPARSGTKIMRDVLARHEQVDKVGFDVNFIWKFGSKEETDLLNPNEITSRKQKFITNYLRKHQSKEGNYVIEKTVGNTIRVPYLKQMFPDAKFIFLLREGTDVVESVYRQWFVTPKKNYLLKKTLTIPFRVLLSYGPKFISKILTKKSTEYFWGVNVPGMHNITPLELKIAYQWQYCIESMRNSLGQLDRRNVCFVKYSDFVNNPKEEVWRVLKFIDPSLQVDQINLSDIKPNNLGKGAKGFTKAQMDSISAYVKKGNNHIKEMI